ncbi:troponin C, isoallergen Bla g 6.0101-like [Oratosquilla oratoria]|uniref:troponin C, isoallergen Bla g 6.0101-like n=1 Tax=Oratosquilla oratoria TaxID=337810 RepID=UPI003F75A997
MDLDEKTMHTLRKTFAVFDKTKSGFVSTQSVADMLNNLGTDFDLEVLRATIQRIDNEDEGKVNFNGFVMIATSFMQEDDEETIISELREAFRLYDKDGNGFITTNTLREILKEIDNKLSDEDLDDIIEEIDEDGKGKVDFEGFKELMI